MTHNARIRLDSAWTTSFVVTGTEWAALDSRLTKAINGDGGGSWTPTAHLAIGGAGMWLAGATNTLGGTNSQITTSVSGQKVITHGDDDHLLLAGAHSGRSRVITVCFDSGVAATGWDDQLGPSGTPVATVVGATMFVPLRVHHGATLASVTFRFAVASSHGPPFSLPQFRVFALARGVKTPLLTNGSSGYVPFTPTPGNGAGWFAGGAAQSLVYTLNAGVVIDTSRYTYWAEIIDEQGLSAAPGNIYLDATCSFTGIADLRPQ